MLSNTKTVEKRYQAFEQKSIDALYQFEATITNLKATNEELAKVHAEIEEQIEKLKMLKIDVANRIASNEHAINGLQAILKNE